MNTLDSNAALAQWKYTVAILGWHEKDKYAEYLDKLASSLWPALANTRQGLLFVLSSFCPNRYFREALIEILPKRPDWVSSQEWHIFMEAAATSDKLDTDLSNMLFSKAPKKYRTFLAQNPAVSADVREKLFQEGKPAVLLELSKNSNLSTKEIKSLVGLSNTDILKNLVHTFRKNPLALHVIAQNLLDAEKHREIYDFLQGALCSEKEFELQIDHWLLKSNTNALFGCLVNSTVIRQTYERLRHTSSTTRYQMLVASTESKSISEEMGLLLSHHLQDEQLRLLATSHPSTSMEALINLSVDESPNVRASAIRNIPENPPSGLFEQLAFDEDSEEALAALLMRPELDTSYRVKLMMKISDPWLLREIMKGADELPEEFFHYAISLEPSLLGYAVQHKNCPDTFVGEALKSSIEVERIAAGGPLAPEDR
jgi:hypothetical protein